MIPATRRECAGRVLADERLSAAQEPFRAVDPTSAFDAPTYQNRSLDAGLPFALRIRELMGADPVGSRALVRARIRRVVEYSAKLGRRRGVVDDVDLFTVLPTISS